MISNAYKIAEEKYKILYPDKKEIVNPKSVQAEIIKMNKEYYSQFYLKTRNDVAMPNAYAPLNFSRSHASLGGNKNDNVIMKVLDQKIT